MKCSKYICIYVYMGRHGNGEENQGGNEGEGGQNDDSSMACQIAAETLQYFLVSPH
jgi:hypothetical protein